jgi:ABC-type uncharacterized transport system substrate-binding protein
MKRATTYVDRILKGEKPADLPVQAPVKLDLLVNLKTAGHLAWPFPNRFCCARRKSSSERGILANTSASWLLSDDGMFRPS